MFNKSHTKPFGILLASVGALSLAACGSSGSYRVASVGTTSVGTTPTDTGSGGTADGGTGAGSGTGTGTGSGTGSTGGSGSTGTGTGGMTTSGVPVVGAVMVTAGNTVIGLSGKHNALATKINGLAPGTTTITGTVTNVLAKTGQSLVDLGQGQSLILNGAGGKLGEVVKIDLASKTVTGASAGSGLLGVSVLSPVVATGSVAAVNLGNSGALVTVGAAANTGSVLAPVTTAVNGVTGGTGGALAPVTTVVNGVTGGTTGGVLVPVTTVVNGVTSGATGSVLVPVTAVVGGVTSGLTGNITGSVNGSATATGGVNTAGALAPVTTAVGGLTGKVGGLTGH